MLCFQVLWLFKMLAHAHVTVACAVACSFANFYRLLCCLGCFAYRMSDTNDACSRNDVACLEHDATSASPNSQLELRRELERNEVTV